MPIGKVSFPPSSHRGLGRRKTRSSSRASLARRRSDLPNASGHGRATSAVVSKRPLSMPRRSRPSAGRRNRQGRRYEAALPLLLNRLQQQQGAASSPTSRTLADLERLAGEDRPRYLQWELHQRNIAAVAQQLRRPSSVRSARIGSSSREFAKRQDELFTEKVPDMADRKGREAARARPYPRSRTSASRTRSWQRHWNGGQRDVAYAIIECSSSVRDASPCGVTPRPRRKPQPPSPFRPFSGPASRSPAGRRTTRKSKTSPSGSKPPAA